MRKHIKPSQLRDEDYITYLVGRVVTAWGVVDQRLYFDIIRFEMAAKRATYPHQVDVPDTFERRLAMWRKLMVADQHMTPAMQSKMDKVLDQLRKKQLVRHHVAHGQVTHLKIAKDGTRTKRAHAHIFEHRETKKRIRYYEQLAATSGTGRVLASDLHPIYSMDELRENAREGDMMAKNLGTVSEAFIPYPRPRILSLRRSKKEKKKASARNTV